MVVGRGLCRKVWPHYVWILLTYRMGLARVVNTNLQIEDLCKTVGGPAGVIQHDYLCRIKSLKVYLSEILHKLVLLNNPTWPSDETAKISIILVSFTFLLEFKVIHVFGSNRFAR